MRLVCARTPQRLGLETMIDSVRSTTTMATIKYYNIIIQKFKALTTALLDFAQTVLTGGS